MAEKMLGSGVSFEDAFSTALNREAEQKLAIDRQNAQMIAQRSLQMQQQQAQAQATAIAQTQQMLLEREKTEAALTIAGAKSVEAAKKATEMSEARTQSMERSVYQTVGRQVSQDLRDLTGDSFSLLGIPIINTKVSAKTRTDLRAILFVKKLDALGVSDMAKNEIAATYGLDPNDTKSIDDIHARIQRLTPEDMEQKVLAGKEFPGWEIFKTIRAKMVKPPQLEGMPAEQLPYQYKQRRLVAPTITPGAEPYSNTEIGEFESIGGGLQ